MIKINLPSGSSHLLENIGRLEAYTSSLNTRAALQIAYDRGDWEPYTPPEPEPELLSPNWDGFNAAAMVDPQLNALLGTVLTIAPAIALGVPSALAQVSLNGTEAFAIVFGALCQLGEAAPGARAAWAAMAEANHLPADFVEIIRGTG